MNQLPERLNTTRLTKKQQLGERKINRKRGSNGEGDQRPEVLSHEADPVPRSALGKGNQSTCPRMEITKSLNVPNLSMLKD